MLKMNDKSANLKKIENKYKMLLKITMKFENILIINILPNITT